MWIQKKYTLSKAWILLMPLVLLLGFMPFALGQQTSQELNPLSKEKQGLTIMPIGQLRLFYMSTDNDQALTDYRALAYGGKLGGRVKLYEGFSLTAIGYFSQRASFFDSPAILDPQTNKNARYEGSLVDSTRINREEMALLGEAFLGYQTPKTELMLGRFLPKTMLINAQDGRMTPTFVQGLWFQQQLPYGFELKLGLFDKIAPRNTGAFYEIGDSIGKYPQGAAKIDQPLESRFVAMVGIDWQMSSLFQYSAQIYQIDQLQNSLVHEIQSHIKQGNTLFSFGLLQLYQQSSADHNDWWIQSNAQAQSYSAYLGFRYQPMEKFRINHQSRANDKSLFLVELAVTQILDQGKFQFPREWGIEPFYTFLRRERNEGLANSKAFVFSIGGSFAWLFERKDIQWRVLNGYVTTPLISDPTINKYALGSYTQHNFELKYQADAWLKNLSTDILVVYKHALDSDLTANQLFNKLNLFQINLVLNYRFS